LRTSRLLPGTRPALRIFRVLPMYRATFSGMSPAECDQAQDLSASAHTLALRRLMFAFAALLFSARKMLGRLVLPSVSSQFTWGVSRMLLCSW
jgi:hypothetical protein